MQHYDAIHMNIISYCILRLSSLNMNVWLLSGFTVARVDAEDRRVASLNLFSFTKKVNPF